MVALEESDGVEAAEDSAKPPEVRESKKREDGVVREVGGVGGAE